MQEQEIIHYLKLLGEELKELNLQRPVQLLMIGGAYMVTQFGSRMFTEDIDVLVRLDKYSEEYRRFRSAIQFVAHDVQESQKWLSINIGDFMEEIGKIPKGRLWLKASMLEVYVPDPQYILVLKVLAARDKDMNDIQFLFQHLKIKRRRQVETLLKKYVSQDMLDDEEYAENIQRILALFFD
jgi:uncharacterized nucleotidyltransferase DUF6036